MWTCSAQAYQLQCLYTGSWLDQMLSQAYQVVWGYPSVIVSDAALNVLLFFHSPAASSLSKHLPWFAVLTDGLGLQPKHSKSFNWEIRLSSEKETYQETIGDWDRNMDIRHTVKPE